MKIIIDKNRTGFALVEVVIGIALLTVTFMAVVNLLNSSIRANQANINSFVAYNLAEEQVELLRNIRDSNWVQNVAWNGKIEEFEVAGKFGKSGYYLLSFPANTFSEISLTKDDELKEYEDSKFDKIKEKARLYEYPSFGGFVYSNEKVVEERVDSRFYRFMKIDNVSKDKVTVKSIVLWWEKWSAEDSPQKVEIITELTDFRGGAL